MEVVPPANRARAAAAPTVAVHVDPRPAYEFLLGLVVFATPHRVDSYDVGADWFARVGARVDANLRRAIERLTRGCEHLPVRLVSMAYDLDPPGSVDALLAALAATPPDVVRLNLLGYYSKRTRRRCPPAVVLAAANGERDAQRRFIADTSDGPECERALGAALAAGAEELQALVMDVLGGWRDAGWSVFESEAWPVVEREAERLRERAAQLDVDTLLDEATNGASVWPAAGIDTVHVFPTWVFRPWMFHWEQGQTLIVGVAVPPDRLATDPDEPPDRLVRVARALGDERRLRLLRHLTTGSYTLAELSDRFEIPKTTLLHHLVVLRAAGLVRVSAGPSGRYSLRPGTPLELHRLLDSYLPAVRRDLPAARGATRGKTP